MSGRVAPRGRRADRTGPIRSQTAQMRTHTIRRYRRLLVWTVAAALALSASGVFVAQAASEGPDANEVRGRALKTVRASSLVQSVGINVHDGYNDTAYALQNDTTRTLAALKQLGVRWIRVSLQKNPAEYRVRFLRDVRGAGIRVLGLAGSPDNATGGFRTGESRALVEALTTGPYRGLVQAVEMPNELDLTGGPGWVHDLKAYTAEYSAALRTSAATSRLPIVGPSVGRLAACSGLAQVRDAHDQVNLHLYTGKGIPETAAITPCVRLATPQGSDPKSQPLVATEAGWTTSPGTENGVTEQTAATFLPRALIWNRFNGVSRTFLYELFDEKPDPGLADAEQHYGLFRVSGDASRSETWTLSRKPGFTQVQRLLSFLHDRTPGQGRIPVVRVRNMSPGVQAYAIRHRSGAVDIAYWYAPEALPAAAKRIITLSSDSRSAVTTYSLQSGKKGQKPLRNGSVTVTANQSVQFVRFAPER